MSTTTSTTGNFNQAGMNAYNSTQPGFASNVNSYMNSPFSNPFFQQQQQMGTNQANMMGQSSMSSLMGNMRTQGMQQNSPAALQMIQQQGMQNSANRANLGFQNPMQNAFTAQQNAMGMAGQYKPLQTGQTQSQGGLGSWLPQLLGGGLSMLTGGLLGGGGGGAAGAMSGTMSAMNAAMSPMQSPSMGAGYGSYGGGTSMGQNAPSVGGYNFGNSPFMMG